MPLAPGRALECGSCDNITTMASPHDFDTCPVCLEDITTAVTVSACPDPEGDCGDETHHFGVGMHVQEGV